MDSVEEIKLLTEIKEQNKATYDVLCRILTSLETDRNWIWKILALTIIGAFAVIGVKIAFP